ncbi:MAG: hypothetical protein U9R57_14895 [Thermodesulfobacteriota bacterium]|nr:hypothetical protein [Thermodesulfobacteriota bacterium]
MAKKALDELLADRDDVQLEEVEILRNPLRAFKDGVKFIPTLKSGEERLSGILLSSEKIKAFLEKVQNS